MFWEDLVGREEKVVDPASIFFFRDHLTFLEAAGQLVRERDDVHFVLAGRGVNRKNTRLAALVDDLKLKKYAHLLDERSDIPRIMAALDIMALSSLGEVFPNVVGEAMACSVPCVVADVGDAAYAIGETGITVPPQDPTMMSNAWQQLLAIPSEERQALGQAARQRVKEMFSIQGIAEHYESLYRGMGKDPQHKRSSGPVTAPHQSTRSS